MLLLVVAASVLTESSAGTFNGTTSNASNTWRAAFLAAPTSLTATQTCVAQPVTGSTPVYQTMNATSGSGSSIVLTTPTGTASGDLLLVQIGVPQDAGLVGLYPRSRHLQPLRRVRRSVRR